jgi:hypothetical protein
VLPESPCYRRAGATGEPVLPESPCYRKARATGEPAGVTGAVHPADVAGALAGTKVADVVGVADGDADMPAIVGWPGK